MKEIDPQPTCTWPQLKSIQPLKRVCISMWAQVFLESAVHCLSLSELFQQLLCESKIKFSNKNKSLPCQPGGKGNRNRTFSTLLHKQTRPLTFCHSHFMMIQSLAQQWLLRVNIYLVFLSSSLPHLFRPWPRKGKRGVGSIPFQVTCTYIFIPGWLLGERGWPNQGCGPATAPGACAHHQQREGGRKEEGSQQGCGRSLLIRRRREQTGGRTNLRPKPNSQEKTDCQPLSQSKTECL